MRVLRIYGRTINIRTTPHVPICKITEFKVYEANEITHMGFTQLVSDFLLSLSVCLSYPLFKQKKKYLKKEKRTCRACTFETSRGKDTKFPPILHLWTFGNQTLLP